MEYWDYYEDNIFWNKNSSRIAPDRNHTIQQLLKSGVSKNDAMKLFNSGYVCIPRFDVLIDRFYGGPLFSIDHRTRFPLNYAHELIQLEPQSQVILHKAKSMDELKSLVEGLNYKRDLVFRGQNQNHMIQREINNPYFTIKNYGEISLLPSLWRKMYKADPLAFPVFNSLSLLEWSNIFYSAFDMAEIERRHDTLTANGEYITTMSDMEDCSDEMLREFGKFRMDLSMGMNYNLMPMLTTLLQHYGLLSPVLDLTDSLDVALFFATHQYEKQGNLSSYRFIGSNDRKSILYLLRHSPLEMVRHDERDPVLNYLRPQRPVKQHCVICNTNEYSINLPAYYLQGMIQLDFDIHNNKEFPKTEDIFPNRGQDDFLNALYQKLYKKDALTVFDI